MTGFYVVIDYDDNRNLVFLPTERTMVLEAFADQGAFPMWTFQHGQHEITVYAGALETMPLGDNRHEMELRALAALNLK